MGIFCHREILRWNSKVFHIYNNSFFISWVYEFILGFISNTNNPAQTDDTITVIILTAQNELYLQITHLCFASNYSQNQFLYGVNC